MNNMYPQERTCLFLYWAIKVVIWVNLIVVLVGLGFIVALVTFIAPWCSSFKEFVSILKQKFTDISGVIF